MTVGYLIIMEYCPGNRKNQKRKREILGPPGRVYQSTTPAHNR